MRVFKSRGSRKEISEYVYKAGAAERNGLKLCNGQALSRSVYAALFAEIGTTFGAGDGSTTFNLPDFRGRVPGSAGQGTYTSSFANTAVNATTNAITVADNDSLFTGTEVVLSTTGTAPAGLTAGNAYYVIRASSTSISLATTLANAVAGTAIDITGQGTGTHTLTVTYTNRDIGSIAGEESHALTINEMPSHKHTIQDNYGVQDLEATFNNGNATDELNRTEDTSYTGGSGSHNIMQPTIFAGHWFIYTGVG
jgi:microcystin-dependent protein